MNPQTISSWSIRNPLPTAVLFMVLVIAGLFGFNSLRVNNFPDVDLPVVAVTVVQPGAAPTEMETQVSRVIEDSVAGLGQVRHVNSTVNEGVSTTSIEFQLGTDLEKATNDVRNAVTGSRANLPPDIQEPLVQRIDFTGLPIANYVISADSMSREQLSWFVDNDIAKRLLAIKGVGQVQRDGGVSREIRIKLDPAKLASQGVTAAQVSQALKVENINLPGGRGEIGGQEQAMRTVGSARSIEELRETRIALAGGRSVRLADLGEVADEWSEPRGRARFTGNLGATRVSNQEVVGFGVVRSRGSSERDVAEAVDKAVAQLVAERPDIRIQKVTSTTRNLMESYGASVEALLLGSGLAVFVVWLFLRDWRATVITSLAIPLSLLPTFWIMDLTGQSLNVVTLLALSLTVGILVDDAIVEIENIVRHIRDGKKPYPAAIEAADEIGLAVVATTATLVAVFAPTGFMPGVVGQFFKSFAIACCVSVLFSLVVARTLTPLMGAYFLKADQGKAHKDPFWMGGYLKALNWSLDHKLVVVGLAIVWFFFSFFLASRLPFTFIPPEDQAQTYLQVELPPGSTLQDTDRVVAQATNVLARRPEVLSVYSSVGSATTSAGPGGNSSAGEVRRATLTVNLVPKSKRKLRQQAFEADIRPALNAIPGARIGLGAESGNLMSVTLVGDDPAALEAAAARVENEMRGISGLNNVFSTAALVRPEILIRPKPEQAALLGVSSQDISQAARVATLGDADQLLPKYNLGDRQIPIRVSLAEEARERLDVISNLRVPTATGQSVPLSAVADISFGAGPNQINRLDRRRAATIQAELTNIALGDASQKVNRLPSMQNLPNGVLQAPSGDIESLQEMVSGFFVALLTGLLLMYVVLVLLFRSFFHPVTIMFALPLAFGGAFALLLLSGKVLSMPAFIGMIMLMGIAAKNSILLVDYAIESMKKGMPRREALLDAAHKRARPIVMTTIAMGVGMAPIALGLGAGVDFRQPMGIAVVGGLITSTLLSLLFIPVVFGLVDRLRNWLVQRVGGRFTPEGKDEADGRPAAAE
ncbi:MAG: efflux RND transporter permease subunit [Caulobacteraceae bacterium]|nr:efflux RND transporter permease subunit [Caulobacteraceae bacterium]